MMKVPVVIFILSLVLPVPGIGQESSPLPGQPEEKFRQPDPEYRRLHQKIITGQATLADVHKALANEDIGALTNSIHSLYSMRWHRGVYNLLQAMWGLKSDIRPELQWRQFGKAPARLALAGVLLRIHPFDNQEYLDYLHEHRYDDHEFHRAQVVISLALNGDPVDVPYIKEMADAENVYVAQSAITALGIMANQEARKALIELAQKYPDDAKGGLIREVFVQAYPQ